MLSTTFTLLRFLATSFPRYATVSFSWLPSNQLGQKLDMILLNTSMFTRLTTTINGFIGETPEVSRRYPELESRHKQKNFEHFIDDL